MGNVHFDDNGSMIQGVGGFPPVTKRGGAVYIAEEVALSCQNVVLNDNAANEGGAVYVIPVWDSASGDYRHYWRNCTFAYNVSPSDPGTHGAGYEMQGDDPGNVADTDPYFYNCIFWRNGTGADLVIGANVTAHVHYTDWDMDMSLSAGTFTTLANISTNPKFKNPAARDLSLKTISPCIDAGSTALIGLDPADVDGDTLTGEVLPLDFALNARVWDAPFLGSPGTEVDMGAFEVSGIPPGQ